MWLIVGLGNPGPHYELTRHNIGFLAADLLVGSSSYKKNFNGEISQINLATEPCLVLKPQTFMNRSGMSVQAALAFYKINLSNLIVIHDELDLPLGDLRIKQGGSDGGHNGLKDITRLLGANYIRVRLGIGRPNFKGTEAEYVLGTFKKDEWRVIQDLLPQATTAVESIIAHGLAHAQGKNQIKSQKQP
jgi:PTH1 family peptidyl-tRNA hydrolase